MRAVVSAPESHWHVIHCKPREDDRALEHLQRQGYECYRPLRRMERWRLGRRMWRSESLFPRYLFIRLSCVEDNWYPIRSTRGVHEIVRCAGQPARVRDELIDAIRKRLTEVGAEPYLNPGDKVRIDEPPFSHLEAIFVANDGDERVVLLLNILQKDQRLTFPLSSVRKLA